MNKEVTIKILKENFDKAVKSGVEQAMKECELTIGMTLKEAVERQIPKKPKEYEDKYYACPACGNVVLHKWEKYPEKLTDKSNGLPYCLGCGQRLKWGD